MNTPFPLVSLGDILTRSRDQVEIQPFEMYRQVTVRLWGEGVVLRDQVQGASILATRRFQVRAEQFILSRIDARNGAFGIVPASLDGAVVSGDFPSFIVNTSRLEPKYIGWLSRTRRFVDLCRFASEGTTNRVRIKEDRFLASEIPLPPIDEQRLIVARIEELAGKIDEAQQLRAGLLQDIDLMLLAEYHRIIKHAAWRPLKEVAPLQRRQIQVTPEEIYPELGVRSFGKGTFHKPSLTGIEVGSKRLFRINPGDLVFNNVFAWEGAVAVAHAEDEGRVGSHRFLTCVARPGVARAEFLGFHFLTRHGLATLGDASPGGAGRNRTLGMAGLESIPVPVPNIDAQMEFVSLLSKAEQLRCHVCEAGAKSITLHVSVVDRALRGEL